MRVLKMKKLLRMRLVKNIFHYSSSVKKDPVVNEKCHVNPKLAFAKNLFLGEFDRDFLVYPVEVNEEKWKTLNETVAPIEKYFLEKVDSSVIDVNGKIAEDVLASLKAFGLFGLRVPVHYGGLGLSATEYARYCQITGLDASIAAMLEAHHMAGINILSLYGSTEQKAKYLPRLQSGEWLAAFCFAEERTGSDPAMLEALAKQDESGNWTLNGTKIWVTNAASASFFTVMAKAVKDNQSPKSCHNVTAFIVEKDFPGITIGKPDEKLGLRGASTCEVQFKNTPVPAENVIGEPGQGFDIIALAVNSGKFAWGTTIAGGARRLLQSTVDHVRLRKHALKDMVEHEHVKHTLAWIACRLYAMESMTYLTAGVLDRLGQSDVLLESAIIKVFSLERGEDCIKECLNLLGSIGVMADYPHERYLRDIRALSLLGGSIDLTKLYIASTGLEHAGKVLQENITKLRNPMYHPGFALKTMIQDYKQESDKPITTLHLYYDLAPGLKMSADLLEYCIARLQYGIKSAFKYYGAEIVLKQLALVRLAEVVTHIYAMTAVVSRASNAAATGLPGFETEVWMADMFCVETHEKIKCLMNDVIDGDFYSNDHNVVNVGKLMIEKRKFFITHPLERNIM